MEPKLYQLVKDLIAKASITPDDQACQEYIADFLRPLGFECENLPFGPVKNLWARKGTQAPLFVFAGHTDVVPPGDLNLWDSHPFDAEIRQAKLYGRGAADMKGAIAAMMLACQNLLSDTSDLKGSIAFLITSDEEGSAENGTVKVVEWLKAQEISIDYCLVGEASSEINFGDVIKVGRRGSLNGTLTIYGQQGHIAYPHLADNPIHKALLALHELTQTCWDKPIEHFDSTSFQFSNINAGLGVTNVIPGELTAQFNFRYSPAVTARELEEKVIEILNAHQLNYKIEFKQSGSPFYSTPNKLALQLKEIIQSELNIEAKFTTGGGTSDGRFIAAIAKEILEFGVLNQSIHQINEWAYVRDLEKLSVIYQKLLAALVLV